MRFLWKGEARLVTEIAIRARGIGKEYRIRHQQSERYVALRDVLSGAVKRLWNKEDTAGAFSSIEEFWALRNVSFDVKRGEVVGLIGRNGAGKSTLLKILSRIVEPSAGRVELFGRVSSLLEVGTGFHPELTGRENIFLNGGILGMTRAEIRGKFDEIVAFAEIEKFLDTPVKRYSSGMYVRLAFAVAAHLQSDILIVDEVLSVGDEKFQKKCLDKMGDVSKGGRTVLLVSHDMHKVVSMCERVLLLDAGVIVADGDVTEALGIYLGQQQGNIALADLSVRGDRSGSGEARFRSIEVLGTEGPTATLLFGGKFTQRIQVEVREPNAAALVYSMVKTADGVAVCEFLNTIDDCLWDTSIVGIHTFEITVDKLAFYPGRYSIDLWIATKNSGRVDYIVDAIQFDVIQASGSGLSYVLDRRYGLVHCPASWRHVGDETHSVEE
jgi:lipopolysaccharide transport system ATP-binding protein